MTTSECQTEDECEWQPWCRLLGGECRKGVSELPAVSLTDLAGVLGCSEDDLLHRLALVLAQKGVSPEMLMQRISGMQISLPSVDENDLTK